MAKNSQKYWEQRARQNKLKVIATGERGINELKRLLKTNLDDVQGKIKQFYEKYGDRAEEFMTPAELKKYKAELAKGLKKFPKDKTIKKIAKDDIPKYKIDRLRALETDLQLTLSEATKGQELGIYKTLDDVSKVSQAVLVSSFEGADIEFNRLSTRRLKALLSSDWSGKNWSERLWKDRELVGEKLTEVLEKGIAQGTSLQRMSRELSKLTGEQFNNSFRLIRTESAFIDSSVTLEGYKQAKDELGYTEYIYDAFLDERTSEICKELNGKRFNIDDAEVGVNYPPMHPNCRSTTQLAEDSIDDSNLDFLDNKEEKINDEIMENINKPYEDITQNDNALETMHKQIAELSEIEQNAIKKYTSGYEGEFIAINGTLRGDLSQYEEMLGSKISTQMQEKVNKWIDNIDSAMSKTKLPQNTILYRGSVDNVIGTLFNNKEIQDFIIANEVNEANLIKVKNVLLAKSFEEKGYMSTSYDKFASYKGKVKLKINAPKGINGMLVDEIGIKEEKEVLIKHNSEWKVKNITVEMNEKDRTYHYLFDCYYNG